MVVKQDLDHFQKIHRAVVKVSYVRHNYHFQRKNNLCNATNTVGSGTFVPKAFICREGIRHADYMTNLNN